MNRLPRVKEFLHNEARSYQALEIEYIPGRDPELVFVNKYNREVQRFDISNFGKVEIQELLQRHGIHIWTPKPEFVPPEFAPTANCKAWRQTNNCDPRGDREPMQDAACHELIGNGRSGYCECIGTKPNVEFGCEHTEFDCESQCSSDAAASAVADDEEEF